MTSKSYYDAIDRSMKAVVKVMGIGNLGCHLIENLSKQDISGVKLLAINLDKPCLDRLGVEHIHIGASLTRGFGAGGNPELGKTAALEVKEDIKRTVKDVDMLFILAGMGGGTGSGVAPIIAEIARETGVLTVAVVTMPFTVEGELHGEKADKELATLSKVANATIIIPNDFLFSQLETGARAGDYIEATNLILNKLVREATIGIVNMFKRPSFVNVSFDDIVAFLSDGGRASIGMGCVSSPHGASEAARMAINSPLMNLPINRAKRIIVNVRVGKNYELKDIQDATASIPNCDQLLKVLLGVAIDMGKTDYYQVTLIAIY